MADQRRLSLHEQGFIHLMAYLATEYRHDTWTVFAAEIDDILPHVTQDRPILRDLAKLATALRKTSDGRTISTICLQIVVLIKDWHQARFVAAREAIRASNPEVKHGT
jgi:hypothetical protein